VGGGGAGAAARNPPIGPTTPYDRLQPRGPPPSHVARGGTALLPLPLRERAGERGPPPETRPSAPPPRTTGSSPAAHLRPTLQGVSFLHLPSRQARPPAEPVRRRRPGIGPVTRSPPARHRPQPDPRGAWLVARARTVDARHPPVPARGQRGYSRPATGAAALSTRVGAPVSLPPRQPKSSGCMGLLRAHAPWTQATVPCRRGSVRQKPDQTQRRRRREGLA
jgi:hypothetical protein